MFGANPMQEEILIDQIVAVELKGVRISSWSKVFCAEEGRLYTASTCSHIRRIQATPYKRE